MPKRTDIHSVLIIGAGPVGVNLFLNRTSQGRVATELSYKKLGIKPSKNGQSSLL
jgi:hypothetical protein